MDTCGRCRGAVNPRRLRVCVWCKGDLCSPCWDALGHCGHPEMDAINADMQTASPERRRAMMDALKAIENGPDPKAN